MKARNMTMSGAVSVLVKMAKKGDFGKKKRRALDIAIRALSDISTTREIENSSSPRKTGKLTLSEVRIRNKAPRVAAS